MPTRVIRFLAVDGEEFGSLEEAQAYEVALEKMKAIENCITYYDGENSSFPSWAEDKLQEAQRAFSGLDEMSIAVWLAVQRRKQRRF